MSTATAPKPKRQRLNVPTPSVPIVHATAIYKREEAAKLLRMSQRRLSELAAAGEIKGKRDGNRILFLGESILTWLRTPTPATALTTAAPQSIDPA